MTPTVLPTMIEIVISSEGQLPEPSMAVFIPTTLSTVDVPFDSNWTTITNYAATNMFAIELKVYQGSDFDVRLKNLKVEIENA